MDHYPFEFSFFISGMEVEEFIEILEKAGYTEQAKTCRMQFEKQMKEL